MISPVPTQGLEPKTSEKAVASLICRLFPVLFPAAVTVIVLGRTSRSEIRKSEGRLTGEGIALPGLIFGYAGVMIVPFRIIPGIEIPNLLHSSMIANQTSAVGYLRIINSTARMYALKYGGG